MPIAADSIYLPNNGITTRVLRPIDMSHRYPDPEVDLPVALVVTRAQRRPGWTPVPHDNHWDISWLVGKAGNYPVRRRIHIVKDIGVDHLTNWGAHSKIISEGSHVYLALTTMTFAQRKALEIIASDTPVRIPDGRWNCQDWIVTVLETAVRQDLVTSSERDAALCAASTVDP